MLKSVKMLILTVLLASNCIGQHKYIPFPDSVATWVISSYYDLQVNPKETRYTVDMYGKAVINGKSYQNIAGYIEAGAIRQDTLARKVYFWQESDSTEYLLYDFSVKEGDTIKSFVYEGPSGGHVEEIDSILLHGKYHYRYRFEQYQARVIEGIGNEDGIFSPMTPVFNTSWHLLCMKKNGVSYYPDDSINCSINVSVNNLLNEKDEVELYPNPVIHYLFIKSNFPIRTVTIHNINGELLGTYEFEESLTVKLNLETLTSGIYNINIETSSGRINRRIIVK